MYAALAPLLAVQIMLDDDDCMPTANLLRTSSSQNVGENAPVVGLSRM